MTTPQTPSDFLVAANYLRTQTQTLIDQIAALSNTPSLDYPEVVPAAHVRGSRFELHFSSWTPGTDRGTPCLFARVTGSVNHRDITPEWGITLIASPEVLSGRGDGLWVRVYGGPSSMTASGYKTVIEQAEKMLADVSPETVAEWGLCANAYSEARQVVHAINHASNLRDANKAVEAANVILDTGIVQR